MDMNDRFVAEVIDVFDPEQSGRLKLRIFGLHDDTTRIPDDQLPWARCVFPVTNPVHQGVSGATTGLVKGTRIVGYFADKQRQVPLITGTLGGVANSSYDFPKADRGEDFNEVLNNSLTDVGVPGLKSVQSPTIASIQYLGQDIQQMLSAIGQGDLMSIVSTGMQALSDFNSLTQSLSTGSLDQAVAAVQQFANQFGNDSPTPPQTTQTGTIVTPSTTTANTTNQQLMNTINHIAGNIAPRTSKQPMLTTSDVLQRVSGEKFTMNYVMPSIDSMLNNLKSSNG